MYLNIHTYYSLRYGTISPEQWIEIAQEYGMSTLAMTDINNTSACLDFVRMAKKHKIQPVVGVDFRNGAKQEFVMLAQNNLGFQYINAYLSEFTHLRDFEIPSRAKQIPYTYIIYPFEKAKDFRLKKNEYVGVNEEDLKKLKFSSWKIQRKKLVLFHTASFQNKKGFNAHRLLRAIDNNTLLSKLPKQEQGSLEQIFKTPQTLKEMYQEFPELLTNANGLLARCSVDFDFDEPDPQNQRTYTKSEELDFRFMRKLAYDGLAYRYEEVNEKILQRIEKELNIIQQKGFVSYFLINWKILKYARSKGYFYVGRGSGANSIIAYLLRITDVDPIELDLYFERFINLYRKNPPDFDIDFSWTDRDDITKFIFKTFKNTALIAVYNTFKYKASVRELGKVFGLPKSEMDMLTKARFRYEALDELSKLVLVYSKWIQGFPNYLGIHAGGIVISDKPIHHYVATYMPPKGFATTQFDMLVAEDVGLYKFDILSQRGLGKIKEAVEIVAYNHPELEPLDIHDIKSFKEDKEIKHILRNAKAIGCFYVESPAMRMLLKKLRVDTYLGLVAASSVIRPGVSSSGMMREFILRYRFPEKRKDAHPILLEIMPETYGVMVYQEDVIKVAHFFGGLTLGEADMLRRGMSGKFRSREEFAKVRDLFFDNCAQKGHTEVLSKEIWRQIESFAGYAFAKGHSASYAVESYQSLFLKAYYPLEYMVATINNFGGFYRTEIYVHEARMHGAEICAPDINIGFRETFILGKSIYLGFLLLRSLESRVVDRIVKERKLNGAFLDLDDFIDRVQISLEQTQILIKVNAFRFTGKNKRSLLWDAHMKIHKKPPEVEMKSLFRVEKANYKTPDLSYSKLEDAFDEIELIGFPLCNPFDLLVEKYNDGLKARDLSDNIGKQIEVVGYLVTTKNTKTARGDLMHFGTFLDYDGYFIDTVHFPPVVKKYPFRGRGVYQLIGKVMEEFDCITLEITEMNRLAIIEDPRYAVPDERVA